MLVPRDQWGLWWGWKEKDRGKSSSVSRKESLVTGRRPAAKATAHSGKGPKATAIEACVVAWLAERLAPSSRDAAHELISRRVLSHG